MLEIVRYKEELRRQWDELVAGSINGTFLHSRAFFDHNSLNKQDDYSLLFYKKNNVVGVIPCALYEKDGRKILHSYLRATYGGFIINEEVRMDEAVEMVRKLIEEAKKINVNEIIIRNPFRIFHSALCDETDYAMWHCGFEIKSREIEIAIKLDSKEKIWDRYTGSTQRNIKKGNKTLVIEESSDYETFWEVLTDNLEKKHGLRPTHTLEQIKVLINNVGSDKVKLFAAKLENKMVAGILVFVANKAAMQAQYIASSEVYQQHRPIDVLTDHIAGWGLHNGINYLNLGTANEDNGRKINESLFRFKEGFGGRGTIRETMSLIL